MNQRERNEVVRGLLAPTGVARIAHVNRVAVYAVAAGEALGLSDTRLAGLRYAALLHLLAPDDVPRRYRFLAPARRILQDTVSEEFKIIKIARSIVISAESGTPPTAMELDPDLDPAFAEAFACVGAVIQPIIFA